MCRSELNSSSSFESYLAVARQRLQLSPDSELERLYREQAPRLWRALYAYAGDREVTSDAVAEAFAQLMGRGDAVRDARMWVWKTAFRIAAGELQDRRRWAGEPPDRPYSVPEIDRDLEAALSQLSPRERAVLSLAHAGYSSPEIAHVIGCAPVTVRVHLTRAKRKLRVMLGGPE
jgi:RNA polymerase sigma factor (sigma-70 family)